MKAKLLITLSFAFVCFSTFAQTGSTGVAKDTTYWTKAFNLGLNFSQASFSDNWAGGGVNSIAIGSLVNARANYLKDKISFDNEFEFLYGIVQNKDQNARKSNDRLFLDSKLGYKLTDKWGGFFSLNFISQVAKGYNFSTDVNGAEQRTLISSFLAPAFITSSLGFEYKPNQSFNVRIGPFSPRITVVNDLELFNTVPDNYGVPIGERIRYEWFAFQLFASLDKNLTENINLKSRYMLFANYEELEFDRIDHRLDLTITAKVTKWINVSFSSISIYDFDQDNKIQFSQGLAVGLLYQIGNKK